MSKAPATDYGVEYRDTGCEVSPSCLDCPLPKCKYDNGTGRRRLVSYEQISCMRREGMTMRGIAGELGISKEAVQYALEVVDA
jgi:hypothetical protein